MSNRTKSFTNDRLEVFEETVSSWAMPGEVRKPSDGEPRSKYVASLREDTAQKEVGHAIVWDQRYKDKPIMFPLYCEWLVVPAEERKKGYGKELFLGIEKELDAAMAAVAINHEGEMLLTSLDRPIDSFSEAVEAMFEPMLKRPEVQARLQAESKALQMLQASQIPALPGDDGDMLQRFTAVAPWTMLRQIITAKKMPLDQRVQMLDLLTATLCGDAQTAGDEGRTTAPYPMGGQQA